MSMTASEEIAARKERYSKVEYETDGYGRRIGVSRLTTSQQIKVQEWTPGLDGNHTYIDDNEGSPTRGQSFEIPKRGPITLAAAVRFVNESPIPFPKNRPELDAILDRLEDVGLNAAMMAMARLNSPPKKEGEEDGITTEPVPEAPLEEKAKN